jgi:hypothetical protein
MELVRLEDRLDTLERSSRRIKAFIQDLRPLVGLSKRDQEAWDLLMGELESVDSIAGEVPFAEFRRIASEIAGLRTVERSGGRRLPPGLPRVRIITPASLGYRTWRWIFAPGMADGEFPARTFPNPLLPDSLIQELNRRIRPRRILAARDRSRREPLFLFMILESAGRRATLTWPGRTLEGDTIYPSVYVGEIVRHYERSPIVQLDREMTVRDPGACLRKIADTWRRGGLDDRAAEELLGSDVVARSRWEAQGAARGDIGCGVLSIDTAWHPSELNSLASCPFTSLARHRLKLRAETALDFEVPASEIGILAHAILRDFYTDPVPPVQAEAVRRMSGIIERRLAPVDVSGQGPYSVFDPGLWQIRRRQLVSTLLKYVEFAVRDAIGGFQTVADYLDKPFPNSRLGNTLLAGKPDHVAVHQRDGQIDGVRVDDFKYSALSSATAKQLRESMQVPVYAWLALQALGLDPNVRIEGRYLLLRSPSNPVVAQAIDGEVFRHVRERIERLLEGVEQGRLHPRPMDKQLCPDCDYRRLCRINGG